MAAPTEAAIPDDPLKPANELIRAAARWLIGALGAIGALLVAGSQLSDIGSLDGSASRLKWAVAGLALSLAAILLAIWRVVSVLLPHAVSIHDLADEWTAVSPDESGVAWFKRWRHPAVHYLATHRAYLGGDDGRTVPDVSKAWWETGYDDEENAELIALIEKVEGIAAHVALLSSFRRSRWWISGLVGVAAMGIGLFAWAANPGADKVPDLRNTRLAGADLTGVSLRGADLTGADLTDADLRGAQLDGAVVKDIVWKNTICPDGTNSDDVAKPPNAAGEVVGGTCEGHLSP